VGAPGERYKLLLKSRVAARTCPCGQAKLRRKVRFLSEEKTENFEETS
jgi:hypothetical protein